MAYTHPNLQRIGPANSDSPTLWTYKTDDTQAVMNTAGYFSAAAADLTVGDVIVALVDADGTPQVFLFWVNSNDGTTVDIADGLGLGTTDTD